MNVKLLVLFCFVAAVAARNVPDTDIPKLESGEVEWQKYKKDFARDNNSSKEEAHLNATLEATTEHNKKYQKRDTSDYQGDNQLAKVTQEAYHLFTVTEIITLPTLINVTRLEE